MKTAFSKPFLFEAGPRAVLLLHGFTGSSADVRMLGRFLEKNNYTSYAPHYRGHGVPPEELVKSNPRQWLQDVMDSYLVLKEKNYEQIAVVGLSLGGVLALQLALREPVIGVVTMCSPMTMKSTDILFEGVLQYAATYKAREGKTDEVIKHEVELLKEKGMQSLTELQQLVENTRQEIDLLYAPIFVVQATNDRVINPASATIIYEAVQSNEKSIKWYEKSGHVITLGPEKQQLQEDILTFLDQLDWK